MPRTKPLQSGATENQVTAQVLDAARLFGVELRRRNVGAALNPNGQTVHFGEVGEPDFYALLPGDRFGGVARYLAVEIKKQGFDPRRLSGKAREHFARQLAHMGRVNREGGLALWLDSGEAFVHFMNRVIEWPTIRVEFDADGYPWITDEPESTP